MQINDIDTFLEYLEKVRQRTMRVIHCVPPDKLDWTFREGKFSVGDLIRHLAAIERYMFAETVQGNQSRYSGCGSELGATFEEVVAFVERSHSESVEIFSRIGNEGLTSKCKTPDGASITVWKWLRSMVEHEIHHRGQIYTYLAMLGIETPPLYGLTSEQVLERSAGR